MTKTIRITNCSDPALWYASLVGQSVPFRGRDEDNLWSVDSGGYLNIVRLGDGVVEESSDE